MSKKLLWSIYGLFFVAGIAQAAIVPLLPRLSAEYGLSASETGLLLALPGLATLAVSVPAGVAADRLGARRCTLLAGVVLCVSCLAQAAPSLPSLLVGRLLFGVAYGVLWTTGVAWLAELDTEPGGSRIGPSVTCASVGMMVGPAVGGLVAAAGATGLPFLLIAIASAVVMVPLTIAGARAAASGARTASVGRRRPPSWRGRSATPSRSSWRHRSATANRCPTAAAEISPIRTALHRPGVVAAMGALVVSGAVSSVSQLLISGALQHDGLSSGRIGLAFSVSAISYIAVSLAVVRLGARVRTLRCQRAGDGGDGGGARARAGERIGDGADRDVDGGVDAAGGGEHDLVFAGVGELGGQRRRRRQLGRRVGVRGDQRRLGRLAGAGAAAGRGAGAARRRPGRLSRSDRARGDDRDRTADAGPPARPPPAPATSGLSVR